MYKRRSCCCCGAIIRLTHYSFDLSRAILKTMPLARKNSVGLMMTQNLAVELSNSHLPGKLYPLAHFPTKERISSHVETININNSQNLVESLYIQHADAFPRAPRADDAFLRSLARARASKIHHYHREHKRFLTHRAPVTN